MKAILDYAKFVREKYSYIILTTPGLVVDEELVCSGNMPDKAEVTRLITTALAREESGK